MSQTPPQEKFVLTTSRLFASWMNEQSVSLVFTTYQAGKLLFIGLKPDGSLSVFERSLERCMAAHISGDDLYVSSLYQLWHFQGLTPEGGQYAEYDRLYTPRRSWVTGDIDIHDLATGADGEPVFVNTLFGCAATVSPSASFRPLWKPAFISRLAPEDRCHLNGFAVENGVLRYATAVGRSDVADGWRDHRADGGILIDCQTDEIVTGGLSMPHSPKLYRGRVWLLNAGSGEFGFVVPEEGRFEPVAFCPGFLRGLAFHGDYAIVTLSLPRENRTFSGLPLDDRLSDAGAAPRCGLAVINLTTGATEHWVRIEGIVTELFDVCTLPGIRRPAAIGFKNDEVRTVIKVN